MRRPVMVAAIAAALFTTALWAAPGAGAWSWPLPGPVVQPFRFDPAHPYAAGQHRGIDIAGGLGSAVRAPVSGSVTFAGAVPSSGTTLAIATSDGYSVTLTHLGAMTVAKGAVVAEGDVVAAVGSTSDAEVDQPYVHLGVRLAAAEQGYVDPLTLLPLRSSAVSEPAPAQAVTPVAVAVAAAPAPAAPVAAPPPPPAPPSPAASPSQPTQVAEPPAVAEPEAPAGAEASTVTAQAAAVTVARRADAALVVARPGVVRGPGDARPGVVRGPAARRAPAAPESAVRAPRPATTARPHLAPPAVATTPRVQRPRAVVQLTPNAEPDAEAHAADTGRPAAVAPRVEPTAVGGQGGNTASGPPLATGLTAALAALVGAVLAATVRRRRAPIMERHALLRHDAHLLRQRPPAHRSLVHDHRGGHPHAASPAARRGDVLPYRRRRARDEGVACR